MAAPLQAQDWEVMSPRRSRQTGFTITEMMVVLVIIGVLAAVATPSLTRDSTARKGRDFGNLVAQGLQRAHLDAMSLRVAHIALVCQDGVDTYRTDRDGVIRSLHAPAGVAIWDANTRTTPDSAPTERVLTAERPYGCAYIYLNAMGNAGTDVSSANLASWKVYIRNENLANPNHPDGGFVISLTGLTAFVSTRNFTFSQ